MAKLKIKKGDQVIVRTGKDKGRTGEVIEVRPTDNRVKVQGINMVTRHRRPTQTNAGGIEQMEAPIHVSNIALIDPETNKATRVGYDMADGKKVRVARKSGKAID
jgi:large subunit ribosomal protein L24